MTRDRRPWTLAVVLFLSMAGTVGVASAAGAQPASSLCGFATQPVANGAYVVQNNEFNSSADECVTTDGNADFTVTNSSIANPTNGSPGGYPSIYRGCHYGHCTTNSGLPIEVRNLATGTVRTNWNTNDAAGGAYDVAYDIWFNTTPTTSGHPDGEELMIWLNHNGGVQPRGSRQATVTIDGISYDVWHGGPTVSYVITNSTNSVNDLDIDDIVADSVSRGYIQTSWYLIGVEAGFELWQGGSGMATNSFAVTIATNNR